MFLIETSHNLLSFQTEYQIKLYNQSDLSIQIQPNETYLEYEEPQRETADEEEQGGDLTFVTSPWATKCLVYNDFLYNCHSSHGNKVYWRCHNYSR